MKHITTFFTILAWLWFLMLTPIYTVVLLIGLIVLEVWDLLKKLSEWRVKRRT